MQAIKVTYYPPTNFRGARYKAETPDNPPIWVSENLHSDGSFDGKDGYRYAAVQLLRRLGWDGEMVGGWDGKSEVYVFTCDKENTITR